MQVAYKYGTYTQGTRQQSTDRPYLLFDKLLLNTFMTSQRLTVRNVTLPPEGTTYRTDLLNRHSVMPLVCTSPPENGVLPLPMNGAAGFAYYFHCVKSRRGREVSLLTKSMTSLASRFAGSLRRKGTSRFWVYYPSAHLLGMDLPDTLPGNANIHAWQQSGKPVPEEKPPWT